MHILCFLLHLSTSGTVNNIRIICSIRFSLFITIDRFYKLFLAEGAFVNRRLETISPLFFTPLPSIQPPPLRGTSFHRKEGVSTRAPSLGRGCRAQRGGVGFLLGRRSRLLFAFPTRERLCWGNGIHVSSSIPRKNDRLLRAVVFMCITCLRKRRLNHRIRFNQRFPRTPLPSSSPYRRRSKGSGRGSGHTP